MSRSKFPLVLVSFVALGFAAVTAQADPLVVNPTDVAATLTNTLLAGGGGGITINSSTYTGAAAASGTFAGGTGIIGFESGIVLTSGAATTVIGPNNSTIAGVNNGLGGSVIPGGLDESVLTINFTPAGNNISFSYVFSSEEYNEFVNSNFNDAFVFLVNGINYAVIPGTGTPVEINTVNNGSAFGPNLATGPCVNCALYIDNAINGGAGLNTQMDGLTVVLSFTAPVNNGAVNTLQIAVADRGDRGLDSAVFIQGNLQVQTVPEPATILLLGTGLAGAAAGVRRRRQARRDG